MTLSRACCATDSPAVEQHPAEGIPLATFNTKDYEDFAQHDGMTLFDVS
jgi:hypothetical protein